MKKRIAAILAVCAVGVGAGADAAAAQQTQNGLVNVAVETGDVLSNNRVGIGVAANIAANVCGNTVQVGVLAVQLAHNEGFECSNPDSGATVEITQ
jgi:hypothetical protein